MCDGVVGERTAIGRVRSFLSRLKMLYVGQHGAGGPCSFLRRVPTRMLQPMRENGDEPRVICGLTRYISNFIVRGEEGLLRGSRAAIRLHPPSGLTIDRSTPQTEF